MARTRSKPTRSKRRTRPAQRAARSAKPARKTRTRNGDGLRNARRPAQSRPSRRTKGAAMLTRSGTPAALSFEAGDERSGRAGDALSASTHRDRFPPRRVREAGMTGGETPQRDRVTADDAAPETLLDDSGDQNPADQRDPRPADTALSVVDESAIGAGGGTDEAEDAQRDPISPEEHARLRARVARSGGTIANLEPYESRAGSPGRARNRH